MSLLHRSRCNTFNFSKQLKAFLTTKLFAYSQSIFAQFLINIYFWRITQNIHVLVVYNVIFAIAHVIIYLPAGKLGKEYDRFLPLRIGVVAQLLYLFLILFLGSNVISYIIIIAIIGGIADGMYWSSDNLLKFDLTEPDNRLKFTSAYQILKSIAGSLLPIFASIIVVTNDGGVFSEYGRVFIAATICAVLTLVSSFFISDTKRLESEQFRFFCTARRLWRDKNIRIACYSTFLAEIPDVLPILLGLLLYIGSKTEFSFGSYQFITVLITVVTTYLLGKYFSRKEYRKLLIWGGVANFFCTFILLASQSYFAILLYGILTSIFLFMNVPQNPMILDALTAHSSDEAERNNIRVEYVALQEMFDAGGKIVGYLVLLFVGSFTNTLTVGVVIGFCALSALASNIVITRIQERSFV